MPAAVAMFDRDMRYLGASTCWLEDYRLGSSVIGLSHAEIFPEMSGRWKEVHLRALRNEATEAEEGRFERLDGSVAWLLWKARPWRGDDGEIGGTIVFSEEITERRQVEKSARQNELRLQLALDAASMISFDWNIASDEVRRHEFADAAEPPRVKTFKNFAAVLEAVHSEDREEFLANVDSALASKNGRYENEIRVSRPGGEIAWFLERGRVERDDHGRPARLIGVAQDITDRKQAEEAIREAERRKDAFLAILAHEIRNPLSPIRNAVYLLQRWIKDDPSPTRLAAPLIDTLERQIEHLVHLLDDLLYQRLRGLTHKGIPLARIF
jgi:PAS domain-containing protein